MFTAVQTDGLMDRHQTELADITLAELKTLANLYRFKIEAENDSV